MYKVLVILLFALFVGTASYLLDEMGILRLPIHKVDPASENIIQDLKVIKEDSLFPQELQQVHQVFISDHRTQKIQIDWPLISSRYFPQKKDGLYDLQIEIFDDGPSLQASTESATGEHLVILQFSLFELKSRNKVWELSRSYQTSDLIKMNRKPRH